jgi:electron transfer flavoprotein alpha subunit
MDIADLATLLGQDLTSATYSDIWVVLPDPSALPLLGEARRLADGLGCYVHAVIGDESQSEKVIALGADRVHVAAVPGLFLHTQRPEFAFFPISRNGQAARAAQHHKAGLITDARHLSVDEASRALLGSHPVYGGEYCLDFAITSSAKFATLDARRLPEAYADPNRSGEVVPNEFKVGEPPVRNLGPVDYMPQQWRPLSKAKVIVSTGRGVKDVEGLELVRQLADRLGAALAGDQSARDSGWVDEAHQVGVTAQEVAPDLYLAIGIRGDTIHNAAIANARQVIAIHQNPEAPIFSVADYCVVADPKEFLPKLLAQLG